MKTYHWETDSDPAVFHLPYETALVCFSRIAHVQLQNLSWTIRATSTRYLLKYNILQLAVFLWFSLLSALWGGCILSTQGSQAPSALKKDFKMFSMVSPHDSARCNYTAVVTQALQHWKHQRIPSGWVQEKVSLWWDVIQQSHVSLFPEDWLA